MTQTQQPEALNLEEFRAKVTRAAREPLLSRIKELEAQLSASQPAAQGMDAETQRHAAIGKAIERACMDLPDGTEISVSLEKDAGTVTLIDQDGNEYENFSCDYGFAGVLNEAIDAAMAAHARNKKELSNEHRTNHRSN